MLSLIIKKLKWHKSILALIFILTFFCTFWIQQVNYFENYVIKNLRDPTLPYYIAGANKNYEIKVEMEKVVKAIYSFQIKPSQTQDKVNDLALDDRIWLETAPLEFIPDITNRNKWQNYKYTDLVVPIILDKGVQWKSDTFKSYKIGDKIKFNYKDKSFEAEVIGFGGQGFNVLPVEFLKNTPELQIPVIYYFFENKIDNFKFNTDNVNNYVNVPRTSANSFEEIKSFADYLRQIGYIIAIISCLLILFYLYKMAIYEKKSFKILHTIGLSKLQIRQFYISYLLSLFGITVVLNLFLYFGLDTIGLNIIWNLTGFNKYLEQFYFLQ